MLSPVLEFLGDVKMSKRFALVTVLVIAALGIVFIGLDMLDVEEDFRIHLPTPILNTVFISAVAAPVAYIAAGIFVINGSQQMLWLGCGALAFGVGSLLRAWLIGAGLNVPITIYYSAASIASVLHLIGASLSMAKLRITKSQYRPKPSTVFFYYLGTLASIALITLAAFRGTIPPFYVPEASSTLPREVVRGIATISSLASSFIYLRLYFKSRTDVLYWYSLGLMLFAFGLFFVSQGAVDSRIAWLGRVSQYASNVYFLVAVLSAYKQASARKAAAIS
jgi:hypothetical protein